MNLPSLSSEMFIPGVISAVITALVFCAGLYLFHLKDPSRTGSSGPFAVSFFGTIVSRPHIPLLILSLFPAVLFLFPGEVRAENAPYLGIVYELNESEKTAAVIGPEDEQIVQADIPEAFTHNGTEYRVTSIKDNAFKDCHKLISVVIPDGVKTVGKYAFAECTQLFSVTIPASVTEIKIAAFESTAGLSSVTIQRGTEVLVLGTDLFHGSGVDSVVIEFTEDPTLQFDISPDAGYEKNGNTLLFTYSNNQSLQATLTPCYDISVTVVPEDSGSVTGNGYRVPGENITLKAEPSIQYDFVNWTENEQIVTDTPEYSFTVTKNRNLKANFKLKEYTIKINYNPEEGAEKGDADGGGSYIYGNVITVFVKPAAHYHFVNWTENGKIVTDTPEYSFTVTENRDLTANFELDKHTVTVTAAPKEGGTVSGSGDYDYGGTASVKAEPNEHYSFVNWTENGQEAGTAAEYSFTVEKDRNLTANFKGIPGPLSVTAPKFAAVTYGYEQPGAKVLIIENAGKADAEITSAELTGSDTGSFILTEGKPHVTAGGKNKSYKLQPAAGLDAGTYTAEIILTWKGDSGTETASAPVEFTVEPKPLSDPSITAKLVPGDTFEYTGKEQKVTAEVYDGGVLLAEGTDYEIKKGSVLKASEAGDYKITVTAGEGNAAAAAKAVTGGNYTGEIVLEWHINRIPTPTPEPTPEPTPDCCCFIGCCCGCRLPATGFSSLRPSVLSEQPESLDYEPLRARIMIPSLDVDSELVRVPLTGDTWPVEWLGENAGLLSGTAFPGMGTSVVAAHNTLNDTEFGPFAMLYMMEENDLIVVEQGNGSLKLFRVYANTLLDADDWETLSAIAGQEQDSLVLITCENESAEGGYLNRRVVFARPS